MTFQSKLTQVHKDIQYIYVYKTHLASQKKEKTNKNYFVNK